MESIESIDTVTSKARIAVRGNIGSGKSTLLQMMFTNAEQNSPGENILILEPVDEWKPFLERFRKDPSDINRLALQTKVSLFSKTTTETIQNNPDKNIFIERTVEEHIAIFLDGGEKYPELVKFYKKWNYDNLLTDVIDIYVPANICFERILKREQHGDAGISLEYLQILENKYDILFNKSQKKLTNISGPIIFTGNIGSGKSTVIEIFQSKFPSAIVFKERVDLWGSDLIKFKSTKLPEDLVSLQCKIASCAEKIYTTIKENPQSLILIERSVEENINVFVKPHLDSGFINQDQYNSIVSIWNKWNYDKLTSFFCVLSTPVEECYKRIQSRSQDGDSIISLEYIEELDKVYQNYQELYIPISIPISFTDVFHEIDVPWINFYKKSNVIAVTGNIGSGKSTLIQKMADDLRLKGKSVTVLLEPVDEWGEDLCRFKNSGTVEDLVILQKNIANFSKTIYKKLTEEKKTEWYLIERSNNEHLKIFCEPLLTSGFLSLDLYQEVTSNYRNYDFDKFLTKIIYLDVSDEECFRRILNRSQDGDASIDFEYIKSLGILYSTLYKDGVDHGVEFEIKKN